MKRLPSLDDYDVQDVRPDEAAFWGDDVMYAVEARSDSPSLEGFSVDTL
ncbi:hypothetical protein [Streptomyces sp. NPDC058272]